MDGALQTLPETPVAAVRTATSSVGMAVEHRPTPATIVEPDPSVQKVSPIETETQFTWSGNPWSLLGPCLFNAFMAVITVGVYSFWGRTELRRRMWSCIRLEGEPLVYHGTGLEMFKGFVAAVLVVLLPIFLLSTLLVIAYGQGSPSWALYQAALFMVVYPMLKALATYRARRYRLSRTSWRGIRGSLAGSAGEFAFLSWATSLLYPLTLGWIAPWRAVYIQRFLIADTALGNRPLRMRGSTGKLYLRFALLWFSSFVLFFGALMAVGYLLASHGIEFKTAADWAKVTRTQWLGIGASIFAAVFVWSLISSFYRSSLYNMTANATVLLSPAVGPALPPLRFKLTTRSWPLIWLFVTNQLLSYGTLFVLRPIATARSLRYFTQNLSLVGVFDPARMQQNPHAARAEGEGLAQAFDFDAF